MARDWLSLSSNSMNSLVALDKALTRTVPTAIAPTLATVPNLFNFPDESSVVFPKLFIWALALVNPSRTSFIRILELPIIFVSFS